jgi:hypothetical protein
VFACHAKISATRQGPSIGTRRAQRNSFFPFMEEVSAERRPEG